MGLFDKVLGGTPTSLTPAEGFTGIAVAAVAADGVITQDEVAGLAVSLARTRLFKESNPRQINASFEKVVKIAKEKGVDELLKLSSQAIPGELRPTAFAIATDLVFADGDVSESEKKYLEKIQHTLGVGDAAALKIVEVMAIKNKA
ncbi:MAG TPA: tellurite resistance TerB family protein [Candidatus Thermoplasmatota archaeon]|jgi:tellurite resistance protein|nr:tellurite resistance TerB family protein [Candidatus Thermoplasmatota archaeon]